jgi:hypothetical protein
MLGMLIMSCLGFSFETTSPALVHATHWVLVQKNRSVVSDVLIE